MFITQEKEIYKRKRKKLRNKITDNITQMSLFDNYFDNYTFFCPHMPQFTKYPPAV